MADVTQLFADAMSQYRLSHGLVPAHHRRLADKILIVFHHACDAMDQEAAEHLFRLLELMVLARPKPGTPDRRINLHHLVDAHERLVALQQAALP